MCSHSTAAKTLYIDCTNRLHDISNNCKILDFHASKLDELILNMDNSEFIVPIIGAFSAGKSTILNKLLSTSLLPVSVTPETALATELRYSDRPYIKAIMEDGTCQEHEITAIKLLSQNAKLYSYIIVYINNEFLKEIEPIVLVDMPGFDSPLEEHNKAIMLYLMRGCHYFILSSVEDGTLSDSIMRRLYELKKYERPFSFFLSKIDLKPQNTINKVANHYAELLFAEFNYDKGISCLTQKNPSPLLEVISSLDSNELFKNIYQSSVLKIADDILDGLNLSIKTVNNEKEELTTVIDEITESITSLKRQSDRDIKKIKNFYSANIEGDIIKSVGKNLDNATDEIVSIAMRGNREATQNYIDDIIRTSLMDSIEEKMGEINVRINNDFASSLDRLDGLMKDTGIDDEFIQNLSNKIQSAFTSLQDIFMTKSGTEIASFLGKATSMPSIKALGGLTLGAGALGIAMQTVLPVIGAVIVFLPELLGVFFKGSQEQRMQANIRNALQTEIFPSIKRKLREVLPAQLQEQIGAMVDHTRQQYITAIEEKKNILDSTIQAKASDIKTRDKRLEELEVLRNQTIEVINSILHTEK